MIILSLVVSAKKEIDAIVNSILKNKFALSVAVGDGMYAYYLNRLGEKKRSLVYTIQFATKSLLFEEIQASLKQEFPGISFYIFANPIIHINTPFYDNIKNRVTGVSLPDKENEDIILTPQHPQRTG